jgi:hypothetical protein
MRKPTRDDFGLPSGSSTLSRDDQHRIEQSIAEKIRSYGIEEVDMPRPVRIAVQDRLDAFLRDVLVVPEEAVEDRVRAVATGALGLPPDVVAALNAEKRYRAALKQWESFQTWKRQRNAARAELERRHGYDTKHAMHLVRLMRMGLEVLEQGDLRVRREDAAQLSAIRDGALTFDELLEVATQLQEAMVRAESSTSLPLDVDPEWVDSFLLELLLADAR